MIDSLLSRRTSQWLGVLCLVCAGTGANRVLAGPAAESQDKQPRNSAASEATDAERIDPQAVAELKKMTAFLDRNTRVIIKVRATWEALQKYGGLWFVDESFVVERLRS